MKDRSFRATGEAKTEMIQRWYETWQMIGLPPPHEVAERLFDAYAEPHRKYHTVDHLRECFALYDSLAPRPGKTYRVELALWFHDVVYDTMAQDNEVKSAAWAALALSGSGVPPEEIHKVEALILATRHTDNHQPDAEARLLVDVDLAILGASRHRFAEYEAQIRQEYAWVPEATYCARRALILKHFATREVLFDDPEIRARLEGPAHRNLEASIAALS